MKSTSTYGMWHSPIGLTCESRSHRALFELGSIPGSLLMQCYPVNRVPSELGFSSQPCPHRELAKDTS